jgi:hypothetical protein
MTGIPGVDALVAREGVKKAVGIAKIVVPLLILLGIALTIHILRVKLDHRTAERDALQGWQTQVVGAVAGEVPVERRKTVTAATATDEIHWLGKELRTNSEALRIQSERLVSSAAKATSAVNAAGEAGKRAKEANSALEATRQRILDPRRSTGLKADEWSQL